jgi:hypothetical protein
LFEDFALISATFAETFSWLLASCTATRAALFSFPGEPMNSPFCAVAVNVPTSVARPTKASDPAPAGVEFAALTPQHLPAPDAFSSLDTVKFSLNRWHATQLRITLRADKTPRQARITVANKYGKLAAR